MFSSQEPYGQWGEPPAPERLIELPEEAPEPFGELDASESPGYRPVVPKPPRQPSPKGNAPPAKKPTVWKMLRWLSGKDQ